MVIREYSQVLFSWLLVSWFIFSLCSWTTHGELKKVRQKIAGLSLAALITLIPFTGLSLTEYFLSLNPNFSVGSLALVAVLLWRELFDKPLLSERYLSVFCLWNVLFSLLLFSTYLGIIPYDLYALGYGFSAVFLFMALITFIVIWKWPPLSPIFLAYIAAFNLRLLPSPNFFDYVTDGFLFLMSLGLLFALGLPRRRSIMPQR